MDELRDFEAHLRGFRPVAPRPLPGTGRRWRLALLGALAAAAVVLVAILGTRGPETKSPDPGPGAVHVPAARPPARALTRGQLYGLMGSGEAAVNEGLDAEAGRLLKPVGGEHQRPR